MQRRILALRGQVMRAVDSGDVMEVLNAMKAAALKGDSGAGRVYLEFTIGKPKSRDDAEDVRGQPGMLNLHLVFGPLSSGAPATDPTLAPGLDD